MALPNEVQTEGVINRSLRENKILAVPTFCEETGQYRFACFEKDIALVKGPAGVLEPDIPRWLSGGEKIFVLVPGLAFAV